MKLYGIGLSPFVRKTLIVLAIKELEFEHIITFPGDSSEDYRAICPTGKIPALEDGELKTADSSVICEYLEEAYPEHPVLPSSPVQRARSRWLEEYADSALMGTAGLFFFERIKRGLLEKKEPNETLLTKIEQSLLPPILDYIEGQVPDQGFLFGDLGIADISLFSPMMNASYAGYKLDAEHWPKFTSFCERVAAHPKVVPILDAEKQLLNSMGI